MKTVPLADLRLVARRLLHRQDWPIAAHLALYGAGTLIPIIAIVGLLLTQTADLRRQQSLHEAQTLARQLSDRVDTELERAEAIGQTLSSSHMLDAGDFTAFEAQAREVARDVGVVIAIRNPIGQQIVNTAVAHGVPLPVSNEQVLAVDQTAAATRQPVISGLVIGTVVKRPLVIADIPVVHDGRVIDFINVAVFSDRLSEIVGTGLPDGWLAGVVGADGRRIARSNNSERFVGTINQRFVSEATGAEGTWTGVTDEGTAIVGAYVRSPVTHWIVSVAVPLATLDAPGRLALRWLAGLAIAGLALSGGLGWILSRRISQPIRGLLPQAKTLGSSGVIPPTQSHITEVNKVAAAMRTSSIELERRNALAAGANRAVRENEERLQLAQEAAGIATVDRDMVANRSTYSPMFYDIFSIAPGAGVDTARLLARIHPADRERLIAAYQQLLKTGGQFQDECRIVRPDGGVRWIQARGRIEIKDGRPSRLLGVLIDVTPLKQSEEHVRFLLRELGHRSKNLLTLIQSMARQTAPAAESANDFLTQFGRRLSGIAASNDLLMRQNWRGVPLERLVRDQLALFTEPGSAQVTIEGPAVNLKSETAQSLGLAFHELATNAVKYGALMDTAGLVRVTWKIEAPGEGESRFILDWVETTTSPIAPPERTGFGQTVIVRYVEAALQAQIALSFPPSGCVWQLDAPVSCLEPAE